MQIRSSFVVWVKRGFSAAAPSFFFQIVKSACPSSAKAIPSMRSIYFVGCGSFNLAYFFLLTIKYRRAIHILRTSIQNQQKSRLGRGRLQMTDLSKELGYGLEAIFVYEGLVLLFGGKMGLKFELEGVDLLTIDLEQLHHVHAIPLVLPLLLPRLSGQLLDPGLFELSCPLEVLKSGRCGVFQGSVMRVLAWVLLLDELLKSLHQFGLMLGGMANELLLLKKAHISQVFKELPSRLEAQFVSLGIQPIKDEDLVNVVAHEELQLQVLLVSATDEALFIQFDKL